jgi:acetyl esterase/lipase
MKSTIVYKKEQNFEIKGDFYPVSKESSPVIVYIHGGGLLYGSREDIKKHQVELYHSAGFNVFSIDYRLAPETKLPYIVEDVHSALEWVVTEAPTRYGVDPQRIAVIGSSAGAYLALMSGTFQKNRPQAIVSFYGYGDIAGDWAVQPNKHYQTITKVPRKLFDMLISDKVVTNAPIERRYALYLYARQQGIWIKEISDLNPEINKSELSQFSPLLGVNDHYPPTLLLHGTMDDDVPYEQSLLMHNALQELNVVSRLITIPNGKHVFDDDWENPIVQQAFTEVISFLKTQFG